jgi:hypothetical protein
MPPNQESEQKDNKPEALLPSDVRYALRYREAQLGKSELLDLVRNGLADEALYLLLKIQNDDPLAQAEIMAVVSQSVIENRSPEVEVLRPFLESYINQLDGEKTVNAMKLAQHSRQGFELWRGLYRNKAKMAALRDNPTYILGNSMFFGLTSFIYEHERVAKDLNILMPNQIKDEQNKNCGYVMLEGSVLVVPKGFQRENNAVIIDDVHNTGETEKLVRDFWLKQNSAPEPAFEYVSHNK